MADQEECIVDEIFALYEKYGRTDHFGETISPLEHMSQTAELAILEEFDDEMVLACFFHDIGNLCVTSTKENTMGDYGIKNHEKIGADFLRKKEFPERVAQLVENHVKAKRYLTYKYPEYYDQLSAAGKATLEFQGGSMIKEEATEFEQHPLFMLSILMRKWDEMAKEKNIPVIDLNELKQLARAALKGNERAFSEVKSSLID